MKNRVWITAAVVIFGSICGCNDKKDESSNATDSVSGNQPAVAHDGPPQLIVEAADPQTAVSKFLDALRTGDEKAAAGLLTTKAREETAAHDMVVQPPGAPNASYEVGRVEQPDNNPNSAWVSCIWREKFANGQEEEYEVVWVLSREPSGWRIAGMATQLDESEDPVFLDFENLTELENKVRQAEIASRQKKSGQTQGAGSTVVR